MTDIQPPPTTSTLEDLPVPAAIAATNGSASHRPSTQANDLNGNGGVSRKSNKDRLATQIGEIKTMLDLIAASPDIQAALSAFGYGPEKLAQGNQLYDTVLTLQFRKQIAYGALTEATEARAGMVEQIKPFYMRIVALARLVFKNDAGTLKKLGLNERRKQAYDSWKLQATQFYTAALGDPAILESLAQYSITQADLEAGLRQLGEVEASHARQRQARDEAKGATAARNRALNDLTAWVGDLRVVLQIALRGSPHLRNQFGLNGRAPATRRAAVQPK